MDIKMEKVFDIQVNGHLGIGFDDAELTKDQIHKITEALQKPGEYHYLATIITSDWNLILKNASLIAEAVEEAPSKGLLQGIHLEGPFISPEPGAVGAHDPQYVIPPSVDKIKELMNASKGLLKLVTIAPEVEGAIEFVKKVKELYPKLVISLGHHLGNADDIKKSIKAGVSMATHLGNGIPNEINRHFNPIWPQLASDEMTTCIITDGTHLPEDLITTVLKAKGIDKVIVVSDCSSVAGLPAGTHQGLGQTLVIHEDGSVRGESGTLAGSALNLYECVKFLQNSKLATDGEIKQMVWDNPKELFA
jgi:N-acetylglucosamine-6-phosphate deacetylase